MVISKFLRAFVDTTRTGAASTNRKTVSGSPGSGHQRAPEGTITKRDGGPSGVFGSKPFLTRAHFRRQLKRTSGKVPGGGVYSQRERVAIEKELFSREKFGEYITPYEISRRVRELKHDLFCSRKSAEKMVLRKQIKFLEKLK